MLPPTTCPRCNQPIQPGMNACPSCGQVLRSEEAAQPMQQPAAQRSAGSQQPPSSYPQAYGQSYQYPQQPAYHQAPAYATMPAQPAAGRPTGLLFALAGVSVLAVVEAVVIVVLLVAGGQGATAGTAQTGTSPVVGQQGGNGSSDGSGLPHGVVGQRVESAGLAVTVAEVVNEPDADVASVLTLGQEQKYIAVDVTLENNSGSSIFYTSATFKLRDADGYEYDQYPLAYRQPKLDFGTMSNRDKVRGYINFIVPKDRTGLSLIYQNGATSGYQTIYIDLGQ